MVFGSLITRASLIGLAVACGLLWIQTQRLDRARQTVADQAAEIDGYKEAARIHNNYLARREQIDRDNADLARDLQTMDGRDAPLSDHLRRAAGRVWGTE